MKAASFIATLCLIPFIALHAATPPPLATDAFRGDMVKKHGFNSADLQHIMAQATYQPHIIESISRPYEKQPWGQYQQHFLKPDRIKEGAIFLQQHHETLMRAEKEYGVPASLITAILGVETAYGHYLGQYLVLDSLYTLSFYYPPRSAFFQSELEQFLLLTRENAIDPTTPRGSYAGAIGQPQFMPSSYRRYAVDYDHNGKKDLNNDTIDAIGSVANYFNKQGWHRNERVAVPATVEGEGFLSLSHGLMKPNYTIDALKAHGVTPKHALPPKEKAIFLRLEKTPSLEEYWLGLHNFYVITRYNPSVNYAMAVYQLSEAIQKAYVTMTSYPQGIKK